MPFIRKNLITLLLIVSFGFLAALVWLGNGSNTRVSAESKSNSVRDADGAPATPVAQRGKPTSAADRRRYDLTSAVVIENRLADAVRYLASDDLEGRGPRTRGLDLAADYIAQQFRDAGLRTDHFSGSPFHEFRTYIETKIGDGNELAVKGPRLELDLAIGADFTPLSFSSTGKFNLPVAFVGYGITAAEYGYDDYEGMDVKGRAVVILRREPRQDDVESVFDGTRISEHAYLARKVTNAVEQGASAVIFCTDAYSLRPTRDDKEISLDALLNFKVKGKVSESVPVLHVKRDVLDKLLKATGKPPLVEIESTIDSTMKPQAHHLAGCRISGNVAIKQSRTALKNVIGVLPGRGDLADETVIVGAHYDHLGMGGLGSLAPWTVEIHNGADDNASGTAALLEIARQMISRQATSSRRIVFIAFSAEEMGLIGSERYARSPLHSLENTAAMINLDMVGRLPNNDRLYVYGTGTASEFDQLVSHVGEKHRLLVRKRPSGYGPSDHTSFYSRGVPVLHFFTGLHSDYHRPSDDFEKVNIPGVRRIVLMVSDIVASVANETKRPTRQNSNSSSEMPLLVSSSSRETGPYVGVRVDLANPGLRILEVFSKSPAEQSQLRVGDVVLMADETPLRNADDLRSLVGARKSGDAVKLAVQRDGYELELIMILRDR